MAGVGSNNPMYNNVSSIPQVVTKPRPRVTTTLWEDANTLCFQVEARGISVARREDNDMINGTKLLNVAGMTRGRRDGMLKSEKDRHVVKIGAMHLKGVWIPFDRALAFAQKEGIADMLYPLFVEDIRSFLYRQQSGDLAGPGPMDNLGKPPMYGGVGQMVGQMPGGNQQHGMQLHSGTPGGSGVHPGQQPQHPQGQLSGNSNQGGEKSQAGMRRQEDHLTPQQQQQQTAQATAYGRQYPYVPQYGMQGYGMPNYPYGASGYNSHSQVMFNQDYNPSNNQQAVYYQQQAGYPLSGYDQSQQSQQSQQPQQPQQAQHQQQQQQQPQNFYQQIAGGNEAAKEESEK